MKLLNEGKLNSAEEQFKKILEKDTLCEKAWINYVHCIKQKKSSISLEPFKILSKAIGYNPNSEEIYNVFIDEVFWQDKQKDAILFQNLLIEKNPDISKYMIDLARMYYYLGNYEKSLDLIDSIKISYTDYDLCKVNLLNAKLLFELNKDEEGLSCYWFAVQSIQDSSDIKAFIDDLCYIIKDNENIELQSTPIHSIADFIRRFWLSRDPNLATTVNERIAEHYRRLYYARKNYRRYVIGRHKHETIYEFNHKDLGTGIRIKNVELGDNFLKHLGFRHIPEQRDLDDMGLIYLRHGNPDNWTTYLGDDSEMNLSWQYYERHQQHEMIFHFIKYGGTRGWCLESLPKYFHNRADLGVQYAKLDPTVSLYMIDYIEKIPLYIELNEKNIEHAKNGLQTETSDYQWHSKALEFPIALLSFKGEHGKNLIELYYGIEGKNIEMQSSGYDNFVELNKFIGLYDEKWNEIVRIDKDMKEHLGVTTDNWINSYALDIERFSASPGKYNLEFHLKDKTSGKLGVYKGTYNSDNYEHNDLCLSDIILSGQIEPANETSKFTKGNIALQPHMFSDFKQGEIIGIYFEIYNLTYDPSGMTDFQITSTLQPRGSDDKQPRVISFFKNFLGLKKESVSSLYHYKGQTRDEKIHLNFDISNRESGKYELVIRIEDINIKEKTQKKVPISVL